MIETLIERFSLITPYYHTNSGRGVGGWDKHNAKSRKQLFHAKPISLPNGLAQNAKTTDK